MRGMAALVVAALLFAASACVNEYPIGYLYGESTRELFGPSGGKPDKSGFPVNVTLSGRVTFDRLTPTALGLNPAPVVMPARHVRIEVVRHDSLDGVFAETETDANGDYSLSFDTGEDFYVRARTKSQVGDDAVRHPGFSATSAGNSRSAYAVSSPILHRDAAQVMDLHADTSMPFCRAGAFAALDTIQRLRAAALPYFPDVGPLDLHWTPKWWQARTTFEPERLANPDDYVSYQPQRILLTGGEMDDHLNTDHDEFDETVIARAWVQLLQHAHSRNNGLPGRHDGEELVPNVAFSAGLGMAVGCALLGTDTFHNTYGFPGGVVSFAREFSLEDGVLPGLGTGYNGEYSVAQVVWDILDGGVDGPTDVDGDPAAVSMTDFFASFRALKTRTGVFEVAWLASLLQQLVDDSHLAAADADMLMQAQGEKFPPAGADPFPELVIGAAPAVGTLDAWEGVDPSPGLGSQGNAMYVLRVPTAQKLEVRVRVTVNSKWWRNLLYLEVYSLDGKLFKAMKRKDSEGQKFIRKFQPGTYLVRVRHSPRSGEESRPTSFELRAHPD